MPTSSSETKPRGTDSKRRFLVKMGGRGLVGLPQRIASFLRIRRTHRSQRVKLRTSTLPLGPQATLQGLTNRYTPFCKMTAADSLQRVMDLNNKAAIYVDHGHYSDAICALERATDLISTTAPTSSRERCRPIRPIVLSNRVAGNRATNGCVDTPTGYKQDGLLYIYDRLLLPCVDLQDPLQAESPYNYHTVSKYTLFNLALSHHLHGRMTEDTLCLAKARFIYQRILWGSKNRTHAALLKCLVLNGLADLHHRLGEYDTSRLCLDQVADIATKTKCLARSNVVTGAELRAILLNHLLAQYPIAAQAA